MVPFARVFALSTKDESSKLLATKGSNSRVRLDVPTTPEGPTTPHHCPSCGLLVTAGPHGNNADCVEALVLEVAALRKALEGRVGLNG